MPRVSTRPASRLEAIGAGGGLLLLAARYRNKLNFTIAQIAAKPSFQPIFFPSL